MGTIQFWLTRCQFHQHFTSSFCANILAPKTFCACSLALYFFGVRILAQKLLVKCWWNWPLVNRDSKSIRLYCPNLCSNVTKSGMKILSFERFKNSLRFFYQKAYKFSKFVSMLKCSKVLTHNFDIGPIDRGVQWIPLTKLKFVSSESMFRFTQILSDNFVVIRKWWTRVRFRLPIINLSRPRFYLKKR